MGPGGFHEFGIETDRLLGRHFVEAQARLFADMFDGDERFPEFRQFVAQNGAPKGKAEASSPVPVPRAAASTAR